jgi:hypothetical protein
MQEARRAKMVMPTLEQAQVEKLFPAIAQWVRDDHIEIGDEEGFGFAAMALDYGGIVYEDDRPRTLASISTLPGSHNKTTRRGQE